MRLFILVLTCFCSHLLIAQAPAGYYNTAAGLSCSSLKTALHNITSNGHTARTYGDLWIQFQSSDIMLRPVGSSGSTNVIWDVFSLKANGTANYYFTPGTNQCGNYNAEGQCYNREHSFPASWFDDESPSYTDYHHIFPTDGWVNNKRSNFRFGEVATASYESSNGSKLGSSATAGISGTVFEPRDEYKGDVARAYLYMVTRYQNRITTWDGYATEGALTLQANTFPSVEVNYLKLMLKWHNQDPVSIKEKDRNNAAYGFQGNRNPYVDSPQYVTEVWNANCPGLGALPVDFVSLTGKLNNGSLILNWEVANEYNIQSYSIERSKNGNQFYTLAQLAPNGSNYYQFIESTENLAGQRVYYRIRSNDKDGSYKYSAVFSIHIPHNIKFTLSPNPASTQTVIHLLGSGTNQVLSIYSVEGKIIQQQTLSGGNRFLLNTEALPAGNYMVELNSNGNRYRQQLVVIH
jgi:endonuclease I